MRNAVIERERREHGRRAVAVLPIHYPKELLTALDVLAVELWGPPGPPRCAEAGRLQPYVCPIVRNALAFMASGGADAVDAMLFPHTCDSIQGLASVAPDLGGWRKPALRYMHPKGDRRPSAERLVRAELDSLTSALERLTGMSLETGALERAIDLHRRIHEQRRLLLEERRRVPLDDRGLYALLRRGELLWPEEHLAELVHATAAMTAKPARVGVPIMVTGYVPEPASLFDTLTRAGALVVADDYAAVGRRVLRQAMPAAGDALGVLTELAFALPPCPTRGTNQKQRLDYLEGLYEQSGARGLIIHVVKFCEPELFDVPAIRKRFAARKAPVLYLETELDRELSGQAATRIEAFLEMVAP